MVSRLVSEPQSQQYITDAGVDPQQLLVETPQRVAGLSDVAPEVFRRYFQQCGL